jgi:tetratricopeptide (TPR) repeat protein
LARRLVALFDPAEEGFLHRMVYVAVAAGLVVACMLGAGLVRASRSVTGRYWMGVAFLEAGRLTWAERMGRELVGNPDAQSYGYYRLLAAALRRQGKVDEQLAVFDQAVAEFPDLDVANGHRCWYYSLFDRADEAMDSCDRAVELASPTMIGLAHLWRGVARYRTGDRAGAIADMEAAQQAWAAGAKSTAAYAEAARRWLAKLSAGGDILDQRELQELRGWF